MNSVMLDRSAYQTYILSVRNRAPGKSVLVDLLTKSHPFFSSSYRTDVRRVTIAGNTYILATVFIQPAGTGTQRLFTRELVYFSIKQAAEKCRNFSHTAITEERFTAVEAPENFSAFNAVPQLRKTKPLTHSFAPLTVTKKVQIGLACAALPFFGATLAGFFSGPQVVTPTVAQTIVTEDASRINRGEIPTFFKTAETVFSAISESKGVIRSLSWKDEGLHAVFAFSASGCTAKQFRLRLSAQVPRDAVSIPETAFIRGKPQFQCIYSLPGAPELRENTAKKSIAEETLLALCSDTGISPVLIREGYTAQIIGEVPDALLPNLFAELADSAWSNTVDIISCAIEATPGENKTEHTYSVQLGIASSANPDAVPLRIPAETAERVFGISRKTGGGESDVYTGNTPVRQTETPRTLPLVGLIRVDGKPYVHYSKKPDGRIVCERMAE